MSAPARPPAAAIPRKARTNDHGDGRPGCSGPRSSAPRSTKSSVGGPAAGSGAGSGGVSGSTRGSYRGGRPGTGAVDAPDPAGVAGSLPADARSSSCPPTTRPRTSRAVLVRRAAVPEAYVLVVDDGSPDGTADMAEKLGGEHGRSTVVRRPGSRAGSAYRAGFRIGLERGYDVIVEMDSDLPHDPAMLPALIHAVERGADLAIGSRYVPGGRTPGWKWSRRAISQGGNLYAGWCSASTCATPPPASGPTAATRSRSSTLDEVRADGYGFQIEMAYRVTRNGGRIVEVPIEFRDRDARRRRRCRAASSSRRSSSSRGGGCATGSGASPGRGPRPTSVVDPGGVASRARGRLRAHWSRAPRACWWCGTGGGAGHRLEHARWGHRRRGHVGARRAHRGEVEEETGLHGARPGRVRCTRSGPWRSISGWRCGRGVPRVEFEGELRVDDPDGIVVDAAFVPVAGAWLLAARLPVGTRAAHRLARRAVGARRKRRGGIDYDVTARHDDSR